MFNLMWADAGWRKGGIIPFQLCFYSIGNHALHFPISGTGSEMHPSLFAEDPADSKKI